MCCGASWVSKQLPLLCCRGDQNCWGLDPFDQEAAGSRSSQRGSTLEGMSWRALWEAGTPPILCASNLLPVEMHFEDGGIYVHRSKQTLGQEADAEGSAVPGPTSRTLRYKHLALRT